MYNKIKFFFNENISIYYGIIIIFSILLLEKVVGFAYFNSWDDGIHVNDNYWIINQPILESLKYFWTNIHKGLYMPLTYSVWKLVWVAAQPLKTPEKAMVYHFLCLFFHTINACLVFKIFTKINLSKALAFLGALIFLVHPVQVESFAWISEFKGLFAFFWGALATIWFINWKNTDKKRSYFLSILFFILALLSKPSTVTLPILFTAIWFFIEGKRYFLKTKLKYFMLIAVFFALSAILAIITRIAQPVSVILYDGLPIYCRIIIPFHAFGFYLSQLLIPMPLVSIYPDQLPVDIMNNLRTQFYWLLGFLSIILPIRYKKFRWIWLFELLILPNSGIIPFDYQIISTVADRYQYLAMPVAVFGILKLFGRLNTVKTTIIIIIIAISAIMTYKRTDDWKNSGTLHYSALHYNKKSWQLYVNLSEYLINTDQLEAAIKVFDLADSNNVTDNLLDVNHAICLERMNEKDSAKTIYRKIISGFLNDDGNLSKNKKSSNLLLSTIRYGSIVFKENDYNEAIRSLNVSKSICKTDMYDYITVYSMLSQSYLSRSQSDSTQTGDIDSSIAFATTVLSVEKENQSAIYGKGMAYYFQNNNDSAVFYLEKLAKNEKIQIFIDEYIKKGVKANEFKHFELKYLMERRL